MALTQGDIAFISFKTSQNITITNTTLLGKLESDRLNLLVSI